MKRVLELFEAICAIPHGSGNMDAIADFCMAFAKEKKLAAYRDAANNVVIRKKATAGYENAEGVILQGHLDMVCQKEENLSFDFEKDGIQTVLEGDFLKAKGTTLGADNGIAVAMILAILEREDLSHPALEAVFTTDEEIGMIGAIALDKTLLSGKKMINLDSEEDDVVTVSCAGGSEFSMEIPLIRETCFGDIVTLTLQGLRGGHSGVEIHKNIENASLLGGKVLSHLAKNFPLSLLSLEGGDRSNVIPSRFAAEISVPDGKAFCKEAETYLSFIKEELSSREPDFSYTVKVGEQEEREGLSVDFSKTLLDFLSSVPSGVMKMSKEVEGLVETSLNLGILKMKKDQILLQFALRSNKKKELLALEEKMVAIAAQIPCVVEKSGHYPPWEYREDSALRESYLSLYKTLFGKDPKVEAIHAGLECGVFASAIPELDSIAIGPTLFDVHSVKERMSLSSVEKVFTLLLNLLAALR